MLDELVGRESMSVGMGFGASDRFAPSNSGGSLNERAFCLAAVGVSGTA